MRENPNRMVNCQHAHAVFVWVGYRFMLPSVCESMVTAVAVWVELAAQSVRNEREYLSVMNGAVVGEMKSQRTKT